MAKLKLTNPDKIYWPEDKITKADLLNYYRDIAPYILPHLKNRPLSLKRNPDGIHGQVFFQKDAIKIVPDWIKTFPIKAESTGKTVNYAICNNKDSLLFLANLGCIEMNPWNSVTTQPEKPDYLVMDIDPSDKNKFEQVVDVALVIKDILDKAKLTGYCKTSGSTGLHIYIPLKRRYLYYEVRSFAEVIAQLTQESLPKTTTLERSLSKRKKTQIYIDYLQNSRGQTLASAYSARPKPGATVSAPLEWKEVKHGLAISDFTIKNIGKRVAKKGDLFAGVLGKGADLHKALKLLSV